jgi:hypothetical protein
MSEYRYWRRRMIDRVVDQIRRGDSRPRIDRDLGRDRSLGEAERAAPRVLAWAEQQRGRPGSDSPGRKPQERATATRAHRPSSGEDPITGALKLAQIETEMDVAVLGEVCDGREVVRYVAGDGGSFGLTPGASMPIEDTYCHRVLTGRLSNAVPDAQTNEQVKDLEITRAARVGAYIGVPLTGLDARLYLLCCLAHEQRPQLGERDVLFLRDLGEALLAALEEPRNVARRHPNLS